MKKFVLALLLVCGWAGIASAQVTYDNATTNAQGCTSNGQACGGATQTIAHTVGAGSNRQLGVFVSIGCASGIVASTVSGVTYNGTSLTAATLTNNNPTTARYVVFYTWPTGSQPTSGANNVVVTYSGSGACGSGSTQAATRNVGIISVAGADQSTTLTASGAANGSTGTTASMTLGANSANDLVVLDACAGSTMSANTGTNRWNGGDGATSCNAYRGGNAAGGTTALSATISASDSWIIVGAAFKAAGGAAPSCPKTLSLLKVGCE